LDVGAGVEMVHLVGSAWNSGRRAKGARLELEWVRQLCGRLKQRLQSGERIRLSQITHKCLQGTQPQLERNWARALVFLGGFEFLQTIKPKVAVHGGALFGHPLHVVDFAKERAHV
jgi:hypothetical protein